MLDQRDGGLAPLGGPVDGSPECIGQVRTQLPKQCGAAHVQLAAVHHRPDAVAGDRLELARGRDLEAPLLRTLHDPLRDRVLAVTLHGGGQPERLVLRQIPGGDDVHDAELTARERTGLVEDDGVDVPGLLEPAPVAHQQPVPRAERRRDRDDERDGEPERVRARDDQHRDRPLDGEGAGRVRDQPRDQGERARTDRDERQPERRAVGQRLSPRARGLRLLDEPHDPGERRLLARLRDLDPERAAAVDRATDDLVARPLVDRPGLTRDHRLVHRAAALAHDAVRRHARTRPHQHDVSLRELGDGHLLRFAIHDAERGRGEQLGQLVECAARLLDAPHLHPVAEQHDGDERGQLPPERRAREAERDRGAEDKRDRDRERDQRHHPRRAVAKLARRPPDEHPPAVEEDDRAEDGGDVLRAGEHRRCVAEPLLEQVAPDQRRDREQQREPELRAEHLDAVPLVLVVSGVGLVGRVRARPVRRRAVHGRLVLRPGLRGRAGRVAGRMRFFRMLGIARLHRRLFVRRSRRAARRLASAWETVAHRPILSVPRISGVTAVTAVTRRMFVVHGGSISGFATCPRGTGSRTPAPVTTVP